MLHVGKDTRNCFTDIKLLRKGRVAPLFIVLRYMASCLTREKVYQEADGGWGVGHSRNGCCAAEHSDLDAH